MKLYAYLASGIPAVVSDLGELTDADALREHEAAFLVPPDDPGRLAAAILTLRERSGLRRRLSRNGRRFVLSSRCWRHAVVRLLDIHALRFGRTGDRCESALAGTRREAEPK
jgi:glycosyltransferase involved in cell wall biosynthesis